MGDDKNCEICGTNKSRYSCPRCNLSYCSVSCYQSENHIQCSEIFYEKWVTEELKNCSSDSEAKKRMLEILKQNQDIESDESLDSDDEENTSDLASRLSNVNLDDDEAIWDKLTQDEKHEFFKLVASGNIIKILPEWEPWWKTKKRKMLIQDCEESFDWKSLCPVVPCDIPELSQITKTKPSPNVAFIVLNILSSYVFTVRWLRGAYKDLPVETVSTCIALSASLRNNEVFNSPTQAFNAFEEDLLKCEWVTRDQYEKGIIIEDLADIITDSDTNNVHFSVKAVISDIISICSDAITVLNSSETSHLKRFSGTPPKMKQIQQISRKMSYYLSWIGDHGVSLINALHDFT